MAHVPGPPGWCWLIPDRDLDNPRALAAWTQVIEESAHGVWTNPHWRALIRAGFSEELHAVEQGEPEAWARLVATLPQALDFEEVRRLFVFAVRRRDDAMLDAMMVPLRRALRQGRKASMPSVQKAWSQVQETRLRKAERDTSGKVVRLPSPRHAAADVGTGDVLDDGSEAALLYKYATTRAKKLGTALAIRAPCSDHEHGGPTARDLPLPPGAPMPALRAPTTDPLAHIPRATARTAKNVPTGRSTKRRSRS